MPSSHRRRRLDKTVSSPRRCELSGWQSQTVFSSPQYIGDWTVLSSLSLDPVSKYDITIGNHVANWKLGHDKTRLSSNRISRLHKTVSIFLVANSLDLSPIQFTPRMPTRQDSLVMSVSAVWMRHKSHWPTFWLAFIRRSMHAGLQVAVWSGYVCATIVNTHMQIACNRLHTISNAQPAQLK